MNAEPAALTKDRYAVLVAAIDDGDPTPRETTSLIEVNFPARNPNTQYPPTSGSGSNPTTTETVAAAASVMKDDNMLMIVLGAVAGLLLVIVIVLIVYIIWR